MKRILDQISNSKELNTLIEEIKVSRSIKIKGLAGSLKSLYPSLVHQRTGEPVLIIIEDPIEANDLYTDICSLIGGENTTLYHEEHHTQVAIRESVEAELVSLTDALKVISSQPNRVIITDIESLIAKVPPPFEMNSSSLNLKQGDNVNMLELAHRLALGGFEKNEIVSSIGEYAVRGGLLDLFPLGLTNPLRIEFFGDEIDSIREFDTMSQRSIKEFNEIDITTRVFHSDDEINLSSTLINYLSDSTLIFVDEPERIFGMINVKVDERFLSSINNFKQILHSSFYNDEVIVVNSESQPLTNATLREICNLINTFYKDNYKIYILSEGIDAKRRIEDLLESECDRAFESGEEYSFNPVDLTLTQESLAQGFILNQKKIAILTEHQLFERRRTNIKTSSRNKKFKGFTFRELKQLHKGDYVVHVDKGIGQFMGLETISVAGAEAEAVKLRYAENDYLFVNLSFINRLQKYSSKESTEPKLNKLGTQDWERTKAKAKKRLKDIARELITLYAERKRQKGFAYSTDTTWQRELEASFMYEDTDDQARTTVEIKKDMESSTPMDRLVCGDVGFGKTEVAVRAAFKAVQSGKQVAVLCPTTILAQQHYNTFRDRLGRYAVNVDLLSRFRSKSEQNSTLKKLTEGGVDVLIGTHRILSKDISFKDIGLLIIDEEQRFGVSAKEKLRMIRANIDTLTLTATPIPRTLNFSLLGARDLSLIETPPRNRLPIHTELIQWNDETIREVIQNEIKRGGQCFFVHWKISDIEDISAKIRELVPNSRITIAHGQLSPNVVEKNVMAFIEKKFDILIATKIIESGIDIPAVNTMIVNRADKYGLAELYQLRGRVGRSNIQAFCYMIVPPSASISKIAMRRLQAISELTDLGSGMKLAMKDMEIRGAGNLLGGEQSGYIDDIGFELYQKIIDEAVSELKNEEFKGMFNENIEEDKLPFNEAITIETEQDALITKTYIPSDSERYDFYLRMYSSRDESTITNIENEMRDRFGKLPVKTDRLFEVVKLRLLAMNTGVDKIILQHNKMILELPNENNKLFYEKHFKKILQSISKIPNSSPEAKGKSLRVIIEGVNSIQMAYSIINQIVLELKIV